MLGLDYGGQLGKFVFGAQIFPNRGICDYNIEWLTFHRVWLHPIMKKDSECDFDIGCCDHFDSHLMGQAGKDNKENV